MVGHELQQTTVAQHTHNLCLVELLYVLGHGMEIRQHNCLLQPQWSLCPILALNVPRFDLQARSSPLIGTPSVAVELQLRRAALRRNKLHRFPAQRCTAAGGAVFSKSLGFWIGRGVTVQWPLICIPKDEFYVSRDEGDISQLKCLDMSEALPEKKTQRLFKSSHAGQNSRLWHALLVACPVYVPVHLVRSVLQLLELVKQTQTQIHLCLLHHDSYNIFPDVLIP
mmetsp:Transcript_31672/g.78468  ORF Transcript_31672/g.78468 Transcript_31672/m.78468 type:complete len:225 (-) Transcript_31672:455-1129(-)